MTPAEELRRAARCIDLSVADGLIDEADAATLYGEALMPYAGELYAAAAQYRAHRVEPLPNPLDEPIDVWPASPARGSVLRHV